MYRGWEKKGLWSSTSSIPIADRQNACDVQDQARQVRSVPPTGLRRTKLLSHLRERLRSVVASLTQNLNERHATLPLMCWIIGHKPMRRNGIHALLESAYEADVLPPFDVVICQRCRAIYVLEVVIT